MEIRPAEAADAEAIQAVTSASSRAAYEDLVEDETIVEAIDTEDFRRELEGWLADVGDDPGVIYLVAEADTLLGFVQLVVDPARTPDHVGPTTAFLKSLYVHPDHWGKGIGTRLLDEGISRLPEDREAIGLSVLDGNERAIGLYRSRGYEEVGEGTYEIRGSSYPTLRFARTL